MSFSKGTLDIINSADRPTFQSWGRGYLRILGPAVLGSFLFPALIQAFSVAIGRPFFDNLVEYVRFCIAAGITFALILSLPTKRNSEPLLLKMTPFTFILPWLMLRKLNAYPIEFIVPTMLFVIYWYWTEWRVWDLKAS